MPRLLKSKESLMDAGHLQTAQFCDFDCFTIPVLLEVGENRFLHLAARTAFTFGFDSNFTRFTTACFDPESSLQLF